MTLRNLMTSLLALTLMVLVGGCDSELDETSNLAAITSSSCGEGTELNADGTQCVTAYDCWRGGFCSEAAAKGWFTEADGNIYAGDTIASSGCNTHMWDLGAEFALQGFGAWAVTKRKMCQ
jgi:hypothetical protein